MEKAYPFKRNNPEYQSIDQSLDSQLNEIQVE
jgi:hypothetical protein